MMIELFDVSEFNAYASNWENDPESLALKETYILSAREKVEDYLGYSLALEEQDEYISGIGDTSIYLSAFGAEKVNLISVEGSVLSADSFTVSGNKVTSKMSNYRFPKGLDNIYVNYVSGWTKENLPASIKMAVYRIAALMLSESHGNIGVTSKTFGDQSRTFVTLNDYSKYLKAISGYRPLRI